MFATGHWNALDHEGTARTGSSMVEEEGTRRDAESLTSELIRRLNTIQALLTPRKIVFVTQLK